jgi:hypothetical protein
VYLVVTMRKKRAAKDDEVLSRTLYWVEEQFDASKKLTLKKAKVTRPVDDAGRYPELMKHRDWVHASAEEAIAHWERRMAARHQVERDAVAELRRRYKL